MISVPFEPEKVEFRVLIPGIPLPDKSPKECGQGHNRHFPTSPHISN